MESAFGESSGPVRKWVGLNSKGWRYLRYREGEEALYDIANEWHDLVDSEQHSETLNSMRKKLDAKLSEIAE